MPYLWIGIAYVIGSAVGFFLAATLSGHKLKLAQIAPMLHGLYLNHLRHEAVFLESLVRKLEEDEVERVIGGARRRIDINDSKIELTKQFGEVFQIPSVAEAEAELRKQMAGDL